MTETYLEAQDRLDAEYEELKASYNMQLKALDRGRKAWCEGTGNKDMWPDTAKLIVWLMECYDAVCEVIYELEQRAADLQARRSAGTMIDLSDVGAELDGAADDLKEAIGLTKLPDRIGKPRLEGQ